MKKTYFPIAIFLMTAVLAGCRPGLYRGADADQTNPPVTPESQQQTPQTASEEQAQTPQTASEEQALTPQTASEEQAQTPQTASGEQAQTPQTASEAQPQTPQTASEAQPQTPQTASEAKPQAPQTSYTMEELTAMVDAFETKANQAAPDGANPLEQFFPLKQESDQLEQCVDIYENELEQLYLSGAISADDYRKQEFALDTLDDRLDNCIDRLEYTFGVDD